MNALTDTNLHPATLGMATAAKTVIQIAATVQISLLAGSTFGIWRGLGAPDLSAAAFIEVHQEMVRGLNVLLPVIGAVFLALTAILAFLARQRRTAFRFYVAAIVLGAAGALVTRFWDQPINAQVMTWTVDNFPADWAAIRDSWWQGHVLRTFASIAALVAMLLALKTDRPASS